MDKYLIRHSTLSGIGDAIRESEGSTGLMSIADMPERIKKIPVGKLDTSKITNWKGWFRYSERYETVDSIDTSNGTIFDEMFYGANSVWFAGTKLFEKLNTSNGVSFWGMFYESTFHDFSLPFDTSKATDLSYCFYKCLHLEKAPMLNTSNCACFEYMYAGCDNLKDGGVIDMTGIDSNSGGDTMVAKYMFSYCPNLEKLKIKINEICTSNMTRMFLLNESTESFTDLEIEVVTENGGIKVDDNSFNLQNHVGLSVESLVSVLEALKDNTGESTTYNIYLGENLAKLTTAQKQIAYSKNINLK